MPARKASTEKKTKAPRKPKAALTTRENLSALIGTARQILRKDKQLGNPAYGRVRAATFGSLVDTANARLLKLRTVLADRYGGSSTDELLNRVLRPTQDGLGL